MAFDFTFRYTDDVLSINYDNFIHTSTRYTPLSLKLKTQQSQANRPLIGHFTIETVYELATKLYDKRGYFCFPIVNFPHLSSNIPISPAYGVNISQMIRYARACPTYEQFIYSRKPPTDKLLSRGHQGHCMVSTFRRFYDCDYRTSLCEVSSFLFYSDRVTFTGYDGFTLNTLLIRTLDSWRV